LNDQFAELYATEDFMILLLERDSTTLVTKLNRINHFRYLIFMGNANGVIGYGKGKGNDFETALVDAIRQAKKNLIALDLDHFLTLAAPIKTSYNGLTLDLFPRESMNAWGNPIMATMLMLAGVTHCSFKITARNMSQYNMVYAFFKAMTSMISPKKLAEQCGEKLYHQSFAPWKYSRHDEFVKM
jgi:small subunit ribosomal protein S5